MKKAIIVLSFLAVGWACLILLLRLFTARIRRSTVGRLRRFLENEAIILLTDNAVYLGAEGRGPDLRNGTHGVLALTERALTFMPWHSVNPVIVPRRWCVSSVATDAFLSMTFPGHILVVEADLEGSGKGRLGWLLDGAGGWAREIGVGGPNPGSCSMRQD